MIREKRDIPVYVALNSTPYHVGHYVMSTMQSCACQWDSQLCYMSYLDTMCK